MAGLFERLKADAGSDWSRYIDHSFVRQLGEGTLPEAAFRTYLVQDYLFLIQFARANALGAYKAPNLADLRRMQASMAAILGEMELHVRFCAGWGITPEELEAANEKMQTTAYTRFVLDSGLRGDLLDLLVALSPCVVGYGEIGCQLGQRHGDAEGNPYRDWIAEYAGADYQAVAARAVEHIDALGAAWLTPARYPQLLHIFRTATRLEGDFWQMGLDAAREG